MSYAYDGWAPYVTVAQRRHQAEKELKKLRNSGAVIAPVILEGRKIAKTFWGIAWCDNLERYRDFAHRLERGRSCVRNGLVLDLQIARGKITALVSGAELYNVKITITNASKPLWKKLCEDCSGGIDSLVELLQGRFSKALMARICQQETGLFPAPGEIRFTCSCPDHALMCKHVAAALYGVGARLDDSPELLFGLRAVEAAELLSNLGNVLPTAKSAPSMADTELAALFDLDMAEEEPVAPTLQKPSGKHNAKPPLVIVKPAAKTSAKPAGKTKPAKAKAKRKTPARAAATVRETPKPKLKSTPTQPVKNPDSNSVAKSRTAKAAPPTGTIRKT